MVWVGVGWVVGVVTMTREQLLNQWRKELGRSFNPRQWYVMDDDESTNDVHVEDKIMWVYRLMAGMFVVGFFTPDREWVQDQPFPTQEQAAARVHWLNGGV